MEDKKDNNQIFKNAKENPRCWSDIAPIDILQLFYKRLTLADQIRFNCVCNSWFSTSSNKSYSTAPEAPWLIVDENPSKYKLLSFSESNKIYAVEKQSKPNDINANIAGSCNGWLITESAREIHVLNLFSKVRFDLPPPCTLPFFLLSETPHLTQAGSRHPRAYAISTCGNKNPKIIVEVTYGGSLLLCKIGHSSTSWGGRLGKKQYMNATFFGDNLYVIRSSGIIDKYQIHNHSQLHLVLSIAFPQTMSSKKSYQFYLVVSEGNLLAIKRYYDHFGHKATTGFEIYMVDENCSPPQIFKVNSLKDQILFLSSSSSEAFAARDCAGFQGNHIYFIEMYISGASADYFVYSIEDESFERVILPLNPENFSSRIWLTPRFALNCDENCDCAMKKTNLA